jgi:hypothetical protein
VDAELLKFLVDAGSNGFLIYLVLRLLTRIDAITDRILANQEDAAAERAVIAKNAGLETQDLSIAVQEYKRRKLRQEETH